MVDPPQCCESRFRSSFPDEYEYEYEYEDEDRRA